MDKARRLNGKQSIFYSSRAPFITFPYTDLVLEPDFKQVAAPRKNITFEEVYSRHFLWLLMANEKALQKS